MGKSANIQQTKQIEYTFTSDSINVIRSDSSISIPIGGDAAMKEGYGDKLQPSKNNSVKSIEELYNRILKEIDINLEEARQNNLLENVLGCSSDELIQRYNQAPESFNLIIECIKDEMDSFWPWETKSIDEIAIDANEAYISKRTGGSKLGQWWFNLTKSDSLDKELGILSNSSEENRKEKIKAYFAKGYLGDMSKLSNDEKEKCYQKALIKFGNFLNKYKTAEEKALLTSVIEELSSNSRKLAVELTISSCMNKKEDVQIVANGIELNREAIVSNTDAFGKIITAEDAIEIAHTTFKNMSEEDANNALNKMQTRGQEVNAELNKLLTKKDAGTLSEEELKKLAQLENIKSNYVISGYSGAVTGTAYNENFNPESRKTFYNRITTDVESLNITKEVVANINQYTSKHPEILKASSNIIENVVAQMNNNIETTETQNTNNTISKPNEQTTKEISKEIQSPSSSSKTPTSNNVYVDNKAKGSFGFDIKTTSPLTKANLAYKEVAPTLKVENKPSIPQQEEMTVQTLTEAFQMGYKAYKEYTKNTNDSEIRYLIKTLNECKNPEIIRNVLSSLENYDDSFLGMLAENVKNNDIKKELGTHIDNIEILYRIYKSSNNNSIREFYAERIKKLEEQEQKNNCANDVLMA